MRELIIMQGFSGSGKSYVTDALVAKYEAEGINVVVCSTDDFWYSEVGDNPTEYNFDMKRLGEAHKWNQRRANDSMKNGVQVVIIDNTNTQNREAEPYLNMGKANGYNLRCISVTCAVEVAKKANSERPKTRQVPEGVIDNQIKRMQKIYF
jgi:predicted kinase